MPNRLSQIADLASKSSALDFRITEQFEVAKKEVIRLSGLISLYELKKHNPVGKEIMETRERLFEKYLSKEASKRE